MLNSITAVTYELDDIQAGISELANETLRNIKFGRNSFGLLLCDSYSDHKALAEGLRQTLGIPIVGFSATAAFSGNGELCDSAAILTVVTSDDVHFSIAVSEPLTTDNILGQIESTYNKAKAALDGEPALIMAFPPYILGIMIDIYPRELGRVSGGLPVFGGLPSHDEVYGESAVYCGDTAASDRMALLLMSGAVKPVMTVKNSLGSLTNLKRTVTSSKCNEIYRVGDETFVCFLERFGIDVAKFADSDEKTTFFTSYPLLVEHSGGADMDGIPVVRTLHGVDFETGSGTAIGEVPQGSVISVGILQKSDIEMSARNGVKDLLDKMKLNEDAGYKYSMVFAVSCVARYYVMASDSTLETDVFHKNLPRDIALSGFYSFGEICPTSIRDRASNAAHNESLVMIAL
ncbi:MAG: FIST C-terminal domain-containing protein [Synergistaceae bacterium]|jgi:hypothetical protein|nr:FIST C-terminal domain-containing protein [Synergistaceae bacterium]